MIMKLLVTFCLSFFISNCLAEISIIEVSPANSPSCDGKIKIEASGNAGPFTVQLFTSLDDFVDVQNNVQGTIEFSDLCAGLYVIKVLNSFQECQVTLDAYVHEGCDLEINESFLVNPNVAKPFYLDPVPECGMANGVLKARDDILSNIGEKPLKFEWSTGQVKYSPDFSLEGAFRLDNVSYGTYTLTVTDGYGCTDELVVELDNESFHSFNWVQNRIPCEGEHNGDLQFRVNVPNDYSLSDLDVAFNFGDWNEYLSNGINYIESHAAAGMYVATITDNRTGCVEISEYQLEAIPSLGELEVEIHPSDIIPTCVGSNSGAIRNLIVEGGNPPYSYLWSNGETTRNNNDLNHGPYSVTVTDDCGREVVSTIIVEAYDDVDPIELDVDVRPGIEGYGRIYLEPSGGAGFGYRYQWQDIGNTYENKRYFLASDWYFVTVTDFYGCTAEKIINLKNLDCDRDLNLSVLAREINPNNTVNFYDGGCGDLTFDLTLEVNLNGLPIGRSNPVNVKIYKSENDQGDWPYYEQELILDDGEKRVISGLRRGTYTIEVEDLCGRRHKKDYSFCHLCGYSEVKQVSTDAFRAKIAKGLYLELNNPCSGNSTNQSVEIEHDIDHEYFNDYGDMYRFTFPDGSQYQIGYVGGNCAVRQSGNGRWWVPSTSLNDPVKVKVEYGHYDACAEFNETGWYFGDCEYDVEFTFGDIEAEPSIYYWRDYLSPCSSPLSLKFYQGESTTGSYYDFINIQSYCNKCDPFGINDVDGNYSVTFETPNFNCYDASTTPKTKFIRFVPSENVYDPAVACASAGILYLYSYSGIASGFEAIAVGPNTAVGYAYSGNCLGASDVFPDYNCSRGYACIFDALDVLGIDLEYDILAHKCLEINVPPNCDPENDDIPDYLEPDCDGDGIPDDCDDSNDCPPDTGIGGNGNPNGTNDCPGGCDPDEICFDGVCVLEDTGECSSSEPCPSGQYCDYGSCEDCPNVNVSISNGNSNTDGVFTLNYQVVDPFVANLRIIENGSNVLLDVPDAYITNSNSHVVSASTQHSDPDCYPDLLRVIISNTDNNCPTIIEEFQILYHDGSCGNGLVSGSEVVFGKKNDVIVDTLVRLPTQEDMAEPKSVTLKLFPNPTASNLYFSLSGETGPFVISVYDIFGRMVRSYQNTSYSEKIALGDIQSGLYILQVSNESGFVASGKFVVQ